MTTSSTGDARAATGTTVYHEMQVVHTFAKNAFDEVWTYLQPYRGQLRAHLRIFTLGANEEMHPTAKGITVSVSDVPKLAEALTALVEAAEDQKS